MMAASPDQIRCARSLIVIKDVFPKILRKIITNQQCPMPAQALHGMIGRDREFQQILDPDEKQLIQVLATEGYDGIDFCLLYKLIRYYKLVDEPSRGWGTSPLPIDLKLSDDIERLRKCRNVMTHKPNAELTIIGEDMFFTDVLEIAKRVDLHLQMNFESEISQIQKCNMDASMEEKYIGLLEKYVELKAQKEIGRHTVNIYYGRDIIQLFANDPLARDANENLILYMSSTSNKEEVVRIINSLKEDLNKGNDNILFKFSELGSIVLHMNINTAVLNSRESFETAVLSFIARILSYEHIDRLVEEIIDVRISISNCNMHGDKQCSHDDIECSKLFNPKSGNWIKLHLEVDRSTLCNHESFHRDLKTFVGDVAQKIDHSLRVEDKELEPSIDVVLKTHTIDGVPLPLSATLRHVIKIDNRPHITNCIIVNNQILFTSYKNEKIIIYKIDGAYDRDIRLSCRPRGITLIDNDTVAVSYPSKCYIEILNITTGEVKNTIKIRGRCREISYNERLVYVAILNDSLQVMDLKGNVLHILSLSAADIEYIECYKDRLYYTLDNSIYCCDLSGDTIWQFMEENRSTLSGITTDAYGNVYLVSCIGNKNKLTVISSDGNHHKDLETEDFEFRKGTIYFDKELNILLFSNENNGVSYVFDIK